jgi:CRP-like cAMP-binding protein
MKLNYFDKLAGSMNITADIPEEELNKLLTRTKPITLKKDEYFLRAGEIPKRVGFNIAGLLRLFYIDNNGMEITKHFVVENTPAISFSAFILREESKYYIQAMEETKLLIIDHQTYCELLDSHVCWQIAVRKIAIMLFILKEKREAELLLNTAGERYLQFLRDFPNLEDRINQHHIASYLGITPESLSRIRSNLKQN